MLVNIFLLIFLVAPLSMFIHEIGHILPGLAFRSERCVIHIGRGRVIQQLQIRKVHIKIGLVFFQGAFSINERKEVFSLHEKLWISAGGPVLNGISALFFFSTLAFNRDVWTLFFFFNLYLAVANMIPFSYKEKESDGYRIWQTLKEMKGRLE